MATKRRKAVRKKSVPAATKKTKVSPVVRARRILREHAAHSLASALLERDQAKNKTAKRKAGKRVVAARAAYKKSIF